MSNLPLEIDTKGTCLLCLKPKSVFKRTRDGEERDRLNSTTTTAFKMLLRYLKVDVTKLTHLSSSSSVISSGSDNVNLLVTLCDECSFIATSFLELFQTFENIRLQMDMHVQQLQEVMEKGGKDQQRVQEYDKRMSTGARKDKMNDSMAKSLRNETLAKASSKLARSAPRISLQKITPKSKTSEELETIKIRRKSSRTGSIQSFPVQELPMSSSNMEMKSCETNWSEEEAETDNDSKGPIDIKIESSSEEEDDKEDRANSDVSSCPDDDNGCSDAAADNQSQSEPEDDDGNTEKVTLLAKRWPRKTPLFRVELDLATERYYDKSRKCIRWKCNLCGDTFTGSGNLTTHKLRRHIMTLIKDKLPNAVPEKRMTLALNRIMERTPVISKNRNGSPKYECPFCKKKEWSMIRIHMLQYHLDKVIEELEDCKDIEINAPVPMRRKHRKNPNPASRSRVLKFKCDKCGATLPTALAVKQHKIKEHPEAGADKYLLCDYCERPFTHAYSLRVHLMRKHPAAFFEDKLPPGISDEGFNGAMECILNMAKDIGNSNEGEGEDPNSMKDCILECPYCGKRSSHSQSAHDHLIGMGLHIANLHLEEVIEEATRRRLNISTDNLQMETEGEKSTTRNVDEGVNPKDIKILDVENEGTEIKEASNKLSPHKSQPRCLCFVDTRWIDKDRIISRLHANLFAPVVWSCGGKHISTFFEGLI